MADVDALGATYESIGPRRYLDRFLTEYGLDEAHLPGMIRVHGDGSAIFDDTADEVFQVHESLLRSHGEFLCAGDQEALAFCRNIAEEMVRAYSISRAEAVARINRHWSEPAASGRVPRVWIVGLDLAYHETESYWAGNIYYGHASSWWLPDARPRPLPFP